jgi:hypothetical protein
VRSCARLFEYTQGSSFSQRLALTNRRLATPLFLFIGVVPEHEVQKILHRRVLEQFLMRQKHLILQFSYKSLRNNVSSF